MFRFLFIALTIAISGTCQSADAKTLLADDGTTESLRIVSLAPNLTEFLIVLNGAEQLVGATEFCRVPESKKYDPPETLGGYLNPNRELIVALEPNLILATESNRSLENDLDAMGLSVLILRSDNISEIRDSFLKVAEAVGESDRASELVFEFDQTWNRDFSIFPENERPEILMVLNHPDSITASIYGIGPGTFLDETITGLGGTNWLADSDQSWPVLSRELLVANPPDYIVELSVDEIFSSSNARIYRDLWFDYLPEGYFARTNLIIHHDPMMTIPAMHLAKSLEKLRRRLEATHKLSEFSLEP